MRPVMLDHQTHAWTDPRVLEAMRPFYTERFGNPSAVHHLGRSAREAVAKARQELALLVRAPAESEIIFTSSPDEALALGICGSGLANARWGRHIVVGPLEDPALQVALEALVPNGFEFTLLSGDPQGLVGPGELAAALRDETTLVVLSHGSRSLGSLQPIESLVAAPRERGIPVLLDATSSAGWADLDLDQMGLPLAVLSPSGFHGPKGIGVLYRHRRARLRALLVGGGQQGGVRSGTEDVPRIVGAGAAAALARSEQVSRQVRVGRLQCRLWEGLQRGPLEACLLGPACGAGRLPNHLAFRIDGVDPEQAAREADTRGLVLGTLGKRLGGLGGVSRAAIETNHAALVATLGGETTAQDIDTALDTLRAVVEDLRGGSGGLRQHLARQADRGSRPEVADGNVSI